MVLESLSNPLSAKTHPLRLLILGFVYATAGLFIGNWIFPDQNSLIMVFLTVMACLPLLYNTMKEEEQFDAVSSSERSMLQEHYKIVVFFTFLFIGMTFAYSLWYVTMPEAFTQATFKIQSATIQAINTKLAGNFTSTRTLTHILVNNLKVLSFCISFSFLYGAGAIFILTWNASVISAAIGNIIRNNLSGIASKTGFSYVASYLHIFSLGFLRFFIHGIPEILAYFIAAIAGGIISAAVIREKFGTKNFEKIILDSANLVLISIAILIIAAFIEVYITPALI